MITVGLTGWGDHDSIYTTKEAAKQKLVTYGKLFGTVEVDSMFYAIQSKRNMEKWTAETPANFRFVVKAFQGMTGHSRGKIPFDSEDEMYEAFRLSVSTMQNANKLKAALFQFPPWFDCTRENVLKLREIRGRMEGIPCALEFRNQTWFQPVMRERTLKFMREGNWIHSVCDEPQAGTGSVPIVEEATDSELTIVRMHGRNASGWQSANQPNWREVRYLYRYNTQELEEWAERLRRLERQSAEVCVVFNNNSGGDAADNARELMGILGQDVPKLPGEDDPQQLDLFEF
ncbi:DUF72 domain-containing protein [Saccharibacillus sp. CPCC 101409]|uniref:DUF72 domain-containing protein n=1 Tax=Saccharibacillus sp. CPCC 101409 TaxID=3058041 RepID=UPI00267351DC|nr:DUF72 domain-containing protein [Saccharibacillus sp. CPCC 101409]MDO3410910.1 DUF72 domain-containing protein [Saccharibacillus sp. CPCC 101409]